MTLDEYNVRIEAAVTRLKSEALVVLEEAIAAKHDPEILYAILVSKFEKVFKS